jgi:hypothetical protein
MQEGVAQHNMNTDDAFINRGWLDVILKKAKHKYIIFLLKLAG